MSNNKPSIQSQTLELLLKGDSIGPDEFHRKFGDVSITNTMNRLKSRGVPIWHHTATGLRYIGISDLAEANREFGDLS